MDANLPAKPCDEAIIKEEQYLEHENDQQSMPSCNSSIYSSPTTTPTHDAAHSSVHEKQNDEPITSHPLANNDLADHHEEAERLLTDNAPAQVYKHLVEQGKQRMSNKFEQLEKETGLTLSCDGIRLNRNQSNNANNTHEHNRFVQNNKANNMVTLTTQLHDSDRLRIEKELKRLKEEIHLKDEIIDKMCKIRSQVEGELEDLTASLFEEANKMVYHANFLRDKAEKELVEANLKIDMLSAEVNALKMLVITSTPSRPNPHLHPQLNSPKKADKKNAADPKISSLPTKSPSNYELGKELSSNKHSTHGKNSNLEELKYLEDSSDIGEFDPIYFEEFVEWRKSPTFEPMKSNFMKRIYDEEIYPVFNFKNKNLTASVLRSIENNMLTVEKVNAESFPKKCALLEVAKACQYRMKVNDDVRWYAICQLSRNRITTVCDLFCYLSYVKNGLVKSDTKEIYWQIMKRRHSIASSKLGFRPNPQ